MRNLKLVSLVVIAAITFASCNNNDDPVVVNEEEVITTMTATLTPVGGGTAVTLVTRDADGDGPTAPVVTVSGPLAANTVYNGTVELLNELETPAEDITEEIDEERDEHQFFFTATNNVVTAAYSDTDSNNLPVGLMYTITTTAAGTGTLTITLIHEPDKTATGVSGGDPTNAGGSTDISATFNITVQ